MESIVLPLGHMRFGECCEPLTEIPQVKRMLARYGNGQQKTIVPHYLSDSNVEQEMTPESIDYRLIFNRSQHNLLN